MICHRLKALGEGINGSYFAYEKSVSYREKREVTGFLALPHWHWHWKPLL
jgi:hypothetical protein